MKPYENHLLVVLQGTVLSLDDALEYITACQATCDKHGLRRVLIDERKVTFDLDYHDLVQMADQAVSLEFSSRGFRLAALTSETGMEAHSHFETIIRNRSIIYRAFIDMSEAEDWLLSS